jgi:Domain of unknown function (DUF5668)/B-box zinc finger
MKCAVHPEVEASGYCRNCGKPMCPACVRPVRDVLYCEECLAKVVGLPAPQAGGTAGGTGAAILPPAPGSGVPGAVAGSPVLVFFMGLVPGLGAIYNGEYNKALLHIVVFAGIILGLNLDLGGGADALLICALVVFPFYMAIDAVRSLKGRQSGEAYQDPLENWTKGRAIGPILLIGLGGLFLLRNFGFFEWFRMREIFFPLLLIGLGFWLMRNRISGRS